MNRTAGIVLAGVHRWGESEFDWLLPRPLLPVVHTPLICHVVRWLRDGGMPATGICANSISRLVRHVLGDGSRADMDLVYYEDWTPRGPAGCVRDVADYLTAERLVVVDATILPACDLGALLAAHEASGAALTVVVSPDPEVPGPGRARQVPQGIYVLERSALAHIPEAGYQDLKEVLVPRLHALNLPVMTHTLPAPLPRVTDMMSYLQVNAVALASVCHADAPPPGYQRVGAGLVHESATVSHPERFIGPFLVGPRTVIGESATLVGPVTIGADCTIERGAVVSGSVLWERCVIEAGANVDECVLDHGLRVAPGAGVHRAVRRARPNTLKRLRHRIWPRLARSTASSVSDAPSAAASAHR